MRFLQFRFGYCNGYCKSCSQLVEVKRDSDLPDFCPECRSVDEIDFDIPDEESIEAAERPLNIGENK